MKVDHDLTEIAVRLHESDGRYRVGGATIMPEMPYVVCCREGHEDPEEARGCWMKPRKEAT